MRLSPVAGAAGVPGAVAGLVFGAGSLLAVSDSNDL